MDIAAQTSVPMTVCQMVCFFSITLEIAINGVNIKIRGRYDIFGKRNSKVKKKSVE